MSAPLRLLHLWRGLTVASKASTQNVQRFISVQKGACLTGALLRLPVTGTGRALCTNIQSTCSRVSSIRNFSSLRKTPPSRLRTVQELLLRHPPVRLLTGKSGHHEGQTSVLVYICAVGVFMIGMTYAGVPLYRIFCQATGLGGQATAGHNTDIENMQKVQNRVLKIQFNADTASSMQWNFRPQQTEIKVLPGETALAFYTAKNPTDKPIVGISTYNVIPFEAGLYFNKIQCFCFEEQRLNPHEQVDMPVFFYIDPEFAEDPKMEKVDQITLSYTFFEAKEGLQLPLPEYINRII